jgi:hypothetical protein
MLHNDIELLDSSIRDKAKAAFIGMQNDTKLKQMGVTDVKIHETLRDVAVQMAYYSRGRMSIADVKGMYKAAGLYEITSADAAKPITWTLTSQHLLGKAIDIVPYKKGAAWWLAPIDVWLRMGEIGEQYGLSWGGRWKHTDNPHYQASE